MRSFVIIGRSEDPCCQLVNERLTTLGNRILFLDESRLFPGLRFGWELVDGRSLGFMGPEEQTVTFAGTDGVLARFSGFPVTKEEFQTPDGQYLCSEWHALLRGYLHALPCPVINRVRPELWYKPFLSSAEMVSFSPGLKFKVPRTLVTTRLEEAEAFFEDCGKRITYSPLTIPSKYPIETAADLKKLGTLSNVVPFHLREVISGDALNAYVVGEEVIWDSAGDRMKPPSAIQEHCVEIAASLGLTFCEFHLVKPDRDEWYCFGIACMPDLFRCEEETQNLIAGQLADALLSGVLAAA
jgi:hypothetical protein